MLHVYSAFLDTQSPFTLWGWISSSTTSVQHQLDDMTAVYSAPKNTAAYWWRGNRVMKPISRYMGWLGGHDAQRPMGKFGQDAEVTPLLCSKDILGFFMTTESRDLGLTSHLKDGAFWQFSFLQNPNKQQRRLTCSFIAQPGTQCLFPLSQETEVMSVAAAFPFKTISHIARIRLGNDVQRVILYKLRMKSCPVSPAPWCPI